MAAQRDANKGTPSALNNTTNPPQVQTQQSQPRNQPVASTSNPTRVQIDLTKPKYEQDPLMNEVYSAPSVTHAHTTVASENKRSHAGSLYSYVSTRDVGNFIRELHGRSWNNLNELYFLPTDEPEWDRLDKQHSALLIGFGGLYPCPEIVEPLLAPRDNGELIRILDVGCGTGTWAIEMAQKFPHASVLGIDLAPVPIDAAVFPPNLSFEIDDINHGLSHYWDQYDVIQMKCVMAGITDMTKTLIDLERCLKPGGVFIMIDGDMPFDEHRNGYIKMAKLEDDEDVSAVSEGGSWFRRMLYEAAEACVLAGSGLEFSPVILDNGPWDHELCDPETIVAGSLYLPIGPWAQGANPAETQILKYVGTLMRQNFLTIHRAWHPMLRKHGVDQDTLNAWSRQVEDELNLMKQKMWIRMRFFWCRRRQGEGLPAGPLPTIDSSALDNGSSDQSSHSSRSGRFLYPAIETYHSKEETIAKTKERRATWGVTPQPAVQKALIGN